MTRVLVCDRSILTAREICLRLRRRHGLQATAVHPTDFNLDFDGDAAPSLIVTELQMPMLSGFELVRQVRSLWSMADLPILAYTTMEEAAAWDEAMDLGANAVVVRNRADSLTRFDMAIADLLQQPRAVQQAAPSGFRRFFMPSRVAA